MQKKVCFIDRDGTLIIEPDDYQIDSLEKLQLMPKVIPVLLQLQQAGFSLVMVTNQDGLGTASFPQQDFDLPQQKMLELFQSQGIYFEQILICPHVESDACSCRKPKTGLLHTFLIEQSIDRDASCVIGDRDTDLALAENLGIRGFKIASNDYPDWPSIYDALINQPRTTTMQRTTSETSITVAVNLDQTQPVAINTGIRFFDHMLEQFATHGGFSLKLNAQGDLDIDEHHTVEDCAITLGQAMAKALADKRGIARYGFLLAMDEASAQVALDLSGRAYCRCLANFTRDRVGDFPCEMAAHFFHSFSQSLQATIQIDVNGENNHHMIEAMFKSVGRCLRQAINRIDVSLPSTKGVL